mmetsp:Transcript_11424/g.38081  ORF Transcript_11424/g.38081 Transcript_11424/m.38081 type:complete len:387 (+) Transcript_11424:222-1382(+)
MLVESLRADLPWLHSFDVRDALVVREVLDAMLGTDRSTDGYRRAEAALALSCYFAAWLRNEPGDAPRGRCIVDWLCDKDLELPTSRPLPLAELEPYGWRIERGGSHVISLPLGWAILPPPERSRDDPAKEEWDLSVPPLLHSKDADASHQPRARRLFACVAYGYFALFLLINLTLFDALVLGAILDTSLPGLLEPLARVAPYVVLGLAIFSAVEIPVSLSRYFTHTSPYAPHTPNLASFVSPDGYHVLQLLFLAIAFSLVAASVAVLVWSLETARLVAKGLTFAESREAFPYPWSHVSSLDHAAIDAADELLVLSGHAFVFCAMLSGALQVATQTVHMLYRGLRDGAPRTLTPADESVVSLLRLVPRTERRGAQGGQRCRVGEGVV